MELERANIGHDLPPEYCRYQDEGCEFANSCLDCPLPRCVYEEPGGEQHWLKRLRAREMARLFTDEDRNIDTVAKAQARGQAYLRQSEINSINCVIRIPVNCGQQLYDVIDITDARAGLVAEKKRVLGLILIYNPRRGEYEERLLLGAV